MSNLCPEVAPKPKWPVPAKVFPDLRAFCSQLDHIGHLDYMMSAHRCEIGSYLMHPPPRHHSENYSAERCLESLNNYYLRMMCMLNDSLTTERERAMVVNFPAFIILQNWLPKIQPNDIVKMPWREMDHKDYIFMLRDCHGHASDLKDFFFFRSEANRDKFQKYLAEKYPQGATHES
jgi:hypothetical protein